jgi:transcriptional regulator with XRE-family HTH domain
MDFEAIAADVIRALRGRRSQTALSRRLGYRSNVVYRWESGRAWPTAATVFKAARKLGVDLRAGLRRFHRAEPPWLECTDPASPEGVALMLNDLRGATAIGELAKRAGHSRFAVARWLKGEAEPRLPELFLMVEACSFRLLDWLTILVDPGKLPSTAKAWEELQAARESAYTMPWSHAFLRVLELAAYQSLPRHESGWIARQLGIPLEEEQRCLELLAKTHQIRQEGQHWVPDRSRVVDTRAEPERSRQVKDWWTRVALERIAQGDGILFSYNLFSVSTADLGRIRQAYLAFYQQMRTIIAESEPNEQVVLLTAQMVPLAAPRAVPASRG